MRRDFHAAAPHSADVTDFPVAVPSEAPDQRPDPVERAPIKGEARGSWLRKLWPSRPAAGGAGAAEDPLLAFAPEPRQAAGPQRTAVADYDDDIDDELRSRRPFTWVHLALAALAIIVLAQGVLIVMWLKSGRTAAPAEFGSIKVTSVPAGAAVAVDGVERGTTPFTVQLSPGPHQVVIGGGPEARTQTVDISRGAEATVHVEMQAAAAAPAATATGGLQITTDPPGARVSIDGQSRGTAPVVVNELTPGPHTVTVAAASGGTINRKVTVQEGAVSSLIISMSGGSGYASGWLAISSPISAQVLQNGTLLGTTDTPRIMMPAGRLQLELSNPSLGYRAQRTVQIEAGKTTTLTLDVPRGSLYVNALPWAEVWIDGRKAGETPIGNLQLPIGNHELLLKHPELGEHKRTVVVSAGAPVRVGVDLRK